MSSLDRRYTELYQDFLAPCADRIQEHIESKLKKLGTQYIDRVSARAKSVTSFLHKANNPNQDGSIKYIDPFEQIQDQIGARIVVFYPQSILVVEDFVATYFTSYEEADKHPDSSKEFGYEGKHFILKVPTELLPDEVPDDFPECFELQIKTLFQHAFSEATHDLVYKPEKPITPDQMKRTAYAAASSWGADQVLAQLVNELLPSYPSK